MRRVSFIAALVTVLLAPAAASAFCGFFVAGADTELLNNATMVVMMRDGTRTVLSMQNDYQGPPEDFALVVPVPVVLQEENVKTLDKELFDRVDQLAAPRLVEYWEQDPCMQRLAEAEEEAMDMAAAAPAAPAAQRAADLGVTIEAQFTVGEYEIVILSANDSAGLDTWLREEEYNIPEGAEPALRPYVEAGIKFFVAKVDVTKVTFEDGRVMLSPLRFHYDTEEFSLPVRLGLLNSGGTQDLIVHILAPNQRYEMANYANATIPTNIEVVDDVRNRFGEFYAALYDRTLEQNPRAVVTEYAWQATNCDPCPGPVLSTADLMSLGADVLPGMSGGGRAVTVNVQTPSVQGGGLDANVAMAVVQAKATEIQSCIAGSSAPVSMGIVRAQMTINGTGAVAGNVNVGTGEDAARSCIASVMRTARFPAPSTGAATLDVPIGISPQNPWEVQQQMQSFVLTRLHARYEKEALSEDLVFRPANPIVGGREFLQDGDRLEEGAREASANNFQGRYIIRHRWEGPIECDDPVRGVWGGPPPSLGVQNEVRPARDLAFAPRGNLSLPETVRQNIPEIGITASAIPEAVEAVTGSGGGGAAAGGGDDGGGCGDCRVGGGPVGGGLWLALVAGILALRRRRRGLG